MTPTPAQVAQARKIQKTARDIAVEWAADDYCDVLAEQIAAALATAHAEGRQAALEEAADVVGALPFIVPSELEGEEQFNCNGNYIHDDVVIEWLRARAKASR